MPLPLLVENFASCAINNKSNEQSVLWRYHVEDNFTDDSGSLSKRRGNHQFIFSLKIFGVNAQ